MKLDDLIATIQESILANGGTKDLAAKTIKDIRKAAEDSKADRDHTVKSKHQFVILSTEEAPDLGYVIQMEEAAAPQAVIERVIAAANSFNDSKKGRRTPVTTIGETLQNVGTKWFKHERPANEVTRVKTKLAVARITVKNTLPR